MLTSTVPTDRVLPGYRQDVITVLAHLDQLEPFTTESVSIHQRPSVISLAIDVTCLPPRWGLLLRLNELQKSAESERWPAADWPSDGAFTDARAFIEMLPPSSIPLPHLGLADDGEINFLWNQDGIHVDLGFYGTGTFSYFARGKDDKEFYDDDVPASNGLSDVLVALLRG